MARPPTFLCVSGYEKGQEFLVEIKKLGCRVAFLTRHDLARAAWPREAIDELHLLPDVNRQPDVNLAASAIAWRREIDRVVALDDFDVVTAAEIREHFGLPGMPTSVARRWRDKLAMRLCARGCGIPGPEFVALLNQKQIEAFVEQVPPPWLIKPRGQASAVGIRKLSSVGEVSNALETLGDQRSFHLMERFVPGSVFHVDGIVFDRRVVFAEVHGYGDPPMRIAHEGGVFSTTTLERGSPEEVELLEIHQAIVRAFELDRGVTHVEFLRADDGRFYFLEAACRVGGAHIADLVEHATGINLWREWARIEALGPDEPYELPERGRRYGGLLVSLARQRHPDLETYDAPEVVFRVRKEHHAGLILAASDHARVRSLMAEYKTRFRKEFLAFMPAPTDKPSA